MAFVLLIIIIICCINFFLYTHKKNQKILNDLKNDDKNVFYQALDDALLLLTQNRYKNISFNILPNTPLFVLKINLPEQQTTKEIASNILKVLKEVSFALTLFSSQPNAHAEILKQNPDEAKADITNRFMQIKGVSNYFSPIANLYSFTSCQKYLDKQKFVSLQIKVLAGNNTYYGFCPSLHPGEEITRNSFIIDFNDIKN